jgi:hypothetical protein
LLFTVEQGCGRRAGRGFDADGGASRTGGIPAARKPPRIHVKSVSGKCSRSNAWYLRRESARGRVDMWRSGCRPNISCIS